MATKLTLYIDDTLAENAKKYAKERGLSLSKVVNDFFKLLQHKENAKMPPSAPLTESLRGIMKSAQIDEGDYKRHLEKKYL